MSDDGEIDGEFDADRPEETSEEAVARLRARWEAGDDLIRPELAEQLMAQAQKEASEEHFDVAESLIDEALGIALQLIDEGETDYVASAGRCLIFKAAMTRVHQGPEAALAAFNETIRFLVEKLPDDGFAGRNELAVALMNKADILADPIGAQSAAIASQQQAVRIWQRLVDKGATDFRFPFASSLLTLGESKLESGDTDSARLDFQEAHTTIREGLEAGETGLESLHIQSLLKLSKVYEKTGEIPDAFASSDEAVRLIEEAVEDGMTQVEPALTALYLQQGVLYERVGDTRSALERFDRCRNVYLRMIESGTLGSPGAFFARTGLANVLMCRANMLSDLRQFDDAEQTYAESIRWYRDSVEFQPDEEQDETFIPYSIGVVQLNHANMLVLQERLDEAIGIKDEAIVALKNRYAAGHREILPNIVSAYRKLIGIRRMLRQGEEAFQSLDEILSLLEAAIDEGELEYRGDLAVMYHLRAVCLEELNTPEGREAADKDLFHSMRIFRDLADDETDTPDVQWAKLQWGEILQQIAVIFVRRGDAEAAWNLFQTEIKALFPQFDEGNGQILFDILFGLSQFIEFAGSFLKEDYKDISDEQTERWTRIALNAARTGIDLVERHQDDFPHDVSLELFLRMKTAFFRRHAAVFLNGLGETEPSRQAFLTAVGEWESLLKDTERLRLEKKYYQRESASQNERQGIDVVFDMKHPSLKISYQKTIDALTEKWNYYAGELRQTLQNAALAFLAAGQKEKADELFDRDVELARELIRRELPDADQFLILSLMTYGRALEIDFDKPDSAPSPAENMPSNEPVGERPQKNLQDNAARILPLYEEAVERIRRRISEPVHILPDFVLFKHVYLTYASLLFRLDRFDEAGKLIDDYEKTLANAPNQPQPEVWIDLCRALDMTTLWLGEGAEESENLKKRKIGFLARHAKYGDSPEIKRYEDSVREGTDRNAERSDEA